MDDDVPSSALTLRHRRLACCLAMAWTLCLVGPAALAQHEGIPPEHRAWGAFGEGSWVRLRIVTESFDAEGQLTTTTTTERKTELVARDKLTATVRVEASVEVAGKHFDAAPVTERQGPLGEAIDNGHAPKSRPLDPRPVTVEGRKFVCQVEQIEVVGKGNTRVTKLYYTEETAPYVIRAEAEVIDPESGNVISQRTVETLALEMPLEVLGRMVPTALQEMVHKDSKGTIKTLSWQAADVPGGVVASTTKELDPSGKLIRRSWLELIDYGVVPRTANLSTPRLSLRARLVFARQERINAKALRCRDARAGRWRAFAVQACSRRLVIE